MYQLSLIVIALASTQPAFGQSDDDEARAKELFDNGSILYDEGRYEEAVAAFEAAYALSKKPLLLYNMASALERMGRWEDALDALNGYRAFATADERDTIERRIRSIEERITERRTEASEEATPDPEPAVEPEPAPAPVPATPNPVPADVAGADRGKPVAIALIATGSAGLGVGAVFSGLAMSARGQWRAMCVNDLCPAEASPLIRQDNRRGLVADLGWLVGVGALGGGVAIAIGGKGNADVQVIPAGPGLVMRGRL